MGCTGSKPHLLLSSTLASHHPHQHVNSPQKGFILFNEKTFDYLRENELEIKQKLRKRCETKLESASSGSKFSTLNGTGSLSKALFSNAKRTLLPSLLAAVAAENNSSDRVKPQPQQQPNTPALTDAKTSNHLSNSAHESTSSPVESETTIPTSASSIIISHMKFRDMAIDSAVDYVLAYAINDFDIDNFKSSNQLSLKQIRKDIMKKTNNRQSLSKINSALHSSKAATGNAAAASDMAFYKLALNTAIDEFGSFIQENFIIINECEKRASHAPVTDASKTTSSSSSSAPQANSKMEDVVVVDAADKKSQEALDEESLKLKEAIELARQNFYKGKMSMVCLTKAGGYVVKEINEPTIDSLSSTVTAAATNESSQNLLLAVSTSVTVDSFASDGSPPVNNNNAAVSEQRVGVSTSVSKFSSSPSSPSSSTSLVNNVSSGPEPFF